MKLFIGINFKKGIKYHIQDIIMDIKSYSSEGRFASKDYLHLTIEYLGEIPDDNVNDIINIMNKVITRGFTLKMTNLGFFKKRTGDILWIGFKENKRLLGLHNYLHRMLIGKGFELESRPYIPHITIGRDVIMKENFDLDKYIKPLGRIRIKANSIDLIKSEQVNGKLIYTIIHSKRL